MTNRVRYAVLAALTGLALVAGSLLAGAVFAADPSDCSADKPTIGLDSEYRLAGHGTGTCQDTSLRFVTGEIKWAKRFAPDPLTASVTESGYREYTVDVRTCDRENTRSYYMRFYWTSTEGHHDSPHRKLHAC
jgi:hypothetical protein